MQRVKLSCCCREQQVVFVDEYTAPGLGQTFFAGKSLFPKYVNNPSLILWGTEQDYRIDDDEMANGVRPAGGASNEFFHLKWKLGEGDDAPLFGATEDMVEILAAADAPATTEYLANIAAVNRASIWFKFRPGVWSFEGGVHFLYTSSYSEAFLRRVLPVVGSADRVISTSSSGTFAEAEIVTGTPYIPGGILFRAPLIRVAEDDVFYAIIDRAAGADATDSTRTSQWLKATYHGA